MSKLVDYHSTWLGDVVLSWESNVVNLWGQHSSLVISKVHPISHACTAKNRSSKNIIKSDLLVAAISLIYGRCECQQDVDLANMYNIDTTLHYTTLH